jgi:hypothetical protein
MPCRCLGLLINPYWKSMRRRCIFRMAVPSCMGDGDLWQHSLYSESTAPTFERKHSLTTNRHAKLQRANSALCRTRKSTTVFIRTLYWALFWARYKSPTIIPYFCKICFNIILLSADNLPYGLFDSNCPINRNFSPPTYVLHLRPSPPSIIWWPWWVEIMKVFIL